MSEMQPDNAPEPSTEDPTTGLELLMGNEARVQLLDALLDLPSHREFNKTELARFADVSRKTVHSHLPLIRDLGIVAPVDGTNPTRYRFDTANPISEQLIKLDGVINNAGPGFDS